MFDDRQDRKLEVLFHVSFIPKQKQKINVLKVNSYIARMAYIKKSSLNVDTQTRENTINFHLL